MKKDFTMLHIVDNLMKKIKYLQLSASKQTDFKKVYRNVQANCRGYPQNVTNI